MNNKCTCSIEDLCLNGCQCKRYILGIDVAKNDQDFNIFCLYMHKELIKCMTVPINYIYQASS